MNGRCLELPQPTYVQTAPLPENRKLRRQHLIDDLRICCNSKNLRWGKQVHEAAIQNGEHTNVYVASMLMKMYAKCGKMEEACKVFEALEDPDMACWNTVIWGYAVVGNGGMSLEWFSRMRSKGTEPDARSFVALLKACAVLADQDKGEGKMASRERAMKIHLLVLESGCDSDGFVEEILVDSFAKCGCMEEARAAFDRIEEPDVVSWTALVSGYAENGEGELALELFSQMLREGYEPDPTSFLCALKACAGVAAKAEGNDRLVRISRRQGKELHLLAVESGCEGDIFVQGTLVDMYAKCSCMREARIVFDSIKNPNVVCWNALILGYVGNGQGDITMDLFSRMGREGSPPDATSFVAALKACTDIAGRDVDNCKLVNPAFRERGRKLHVLTSLSGCVSDIFVQGTLIDMYSKFGSIQEARAVFDSIKAPNVVCWNALITGYANNGEGETALNLFSEMKRQGITPNAFSFSTVLVACGVLGALEQGKAFHAEIASCDLKQNSVVATSLLDFYAKCGNLNEAEQVFETHPTKDLITWNALMAGFSCHGETQRVLDLFDKLLATTSLQPDRITFNCIFTACSHAGLVDRGRELFELMSKYGVKPAVEHCNSMLDIFGRSNMLEDGMALLRSMQFSPNAVTWMTVLGSCKSWKNAELGKLAFESVVSLDNEHAGCYVVMANIYGSRGMWADQARMQQMRLKLGVSRTSAQSWWTDHSGVVQTFSEQQDRLPFQVLQVL